MPSTHISRLAYFTIFLASALVTLTTLSTHFFLSSRAITKPHKFSPPHIPINRHSYSYSQGHPGQFHVSPRSDASASTAQYCYGNQELIYAGSGVVAIAIGFQCIIRATYVWRKWRHTFRIGHDKPPTMETKAIVVPTLEEAKQLKQDEKALQEVMKKTITERMGIERLRALKRGLGKGAAASRSGPHYELQRDAKLGMGRGGGAGLSHLDGLSLSALGAPQPRDRRERPLHDLAGFPIREHDPEIRAVRSAPPRPSPRIRLEVPSPTYDPVSPISPLPSTRRRRRSIFSLDSPPSPLPSRRYESRRHSAELRDALGEGAARRARARAPAHAPDIELNDLIELF